jgi:excisionase family DNA binding protein
MKGTLSTSEVARMLGVAVGSVANWIDRQQLKAGRTPGGHRRIEVEDLLDFLKQQGLPIPEELTAEQTGPRVLIVDDEDAVTRLVTAEITSAYPDYDVREAHDGFAAGELVANFKPDVVVLDLRMPGMDGFEVCRRIKSRDETRSIEVIAITAYPSDDFVDRIRECGARICLAKPLDMPAFLNELNSAIGR